MVLLLFEGALRIQDIVGPTFSEFTGPKANREGFRLIKFVGKKTTAREILYPKETIEAIAAYQTERGAKDDDIIFPPASGPDKTKD